MNTIGMVLLMSASRCCRSNPLKSGSPTSSTRHPGRSDGGRARNSRADANVSTANPAERNKPRNASRTEGSSSTTKTAASGIRREGELEGRAGTVLGHDGQAPAVVLDDGATDRQPHAQ